MVCLLREFICTSTKRKRRAKALARKTAEKQLFGRPPSASLRSLTPDSRGLTQTAPRPAELARDNSCLRAKLVRTSWWEPGKKPALVTVQCAGKKGEI